MKHVVVIAVDAVVVDDDEIEYKEIEDLAFDYF
jgi:hypothetical protein